MRTAYGFVLLALLIAGVAVTVFAKTALDLAMRLSLRIWPPRKHVKGKVGACKVCGRILVQGLDQCYIDPGELLDIYYCIDHPPFDVNMLEDLLRN